MISPRNSAWQFTLTQAWARRGVLALCLWPISILFGLLVRVRQTLYRMGWLQSEGVGVPLVVVGNVVAGGVGKTPVVIALVQHWQAQGIHVGVISRGYGRRCPGCLEVNALTAAQDVGDEPTLIQRRTQAPLFVAERRIDAAKALLMAYPCTQLIVSDDGLQHLAMRRDLEIGVFDDRGVGNGWLLPAGPLREPWPRRMDLTLHTGQHPAFDGYHAQRELSDMAYRSDGRSVRLSQLPQHDNKPLLALAAIAQPELFFAMLRAQGVQLEHTLALPDHYDFNSFLRIEYSHYSLICTEKDAVKLWSIEPQALAVPLICTLPDTFLLALDQCTSALLKQAKCEG